MDIRDQMQAIVDRLVGAPPESLPLPSDLDDPWRTIFTRASRAGSRDEAEAIIWKITSGFDDQHRLAAALLDLAPGEDSFSPYPSLDEIAGRFPPVDWLWPSWIPRGLLTLFAGAPGAGKSLVALDLARRIIHGEPFPDGAPVPCPGRNVLIVDAEGTPALLDQRARAWDLDRRRLFLMLAPNPGGLIDLAHPRQQLQLVEMCRDLRPALVVIDSLAAATARGESSLQGARDLLGFLSAIASRVRLAMLVIHHLRKSRRSDHVATAPQVTADDLRGSSHLSAAARSVLALSLPGRPPASPLWPTPHLASDGDLVPDGDPASDDDLMSDLDLVLAGASHPLASGGLRRFEVVKTNLCRHPPPLGLTFEGEGLLVPTLHYTEYVEPPPPPTQLDLCARWLLHYLTAAGAPVRPADVVQAAREAGFPRRTLYRARQALTGAIVDLGNSPRDPHKRWALAGPPTPTPSPE
jgi:hypothetical protein